jgi:hypothetical protein
MSKPCNYLKMVTNKCRNRNFAQAMNEAIEHPFERPKVGVVLEFFDFFLFPICSFQVLTRCPSS